MKILGISGLYHDSAAALIEDGEMIAAAHEERFTRIKHDVNFPENAIRFCMEEAGTTPEFLDAVVYYDNPFLTYHRFISNIATLGADAAEIIDRDLDALLTKKLQVHKLAYNCLGMFAKTGKLLVTKHHAAHAASAFYPSPFEEAAIITADGVGEYETTTLGYGSGNKIEMLKRINYPHSLGLLYSAVTYFCGFKVNSGEYKLMGLAPYGEPVYFDLMLQRLVDVKPDGSYRLNMAYFNYYRGKLMVNEKFAALFGGEARKPESGITRREMDIAASIQRVTEFVMLKLARTAKELTGSKNLVMAGGTALNCVANGKIQRANIFDNIWIQPASGDAGGAVGCALHAYYQHFGNKRVVNGRDSQKGSLLGPRYGGDEITARLARFGAVHERYPSRADLYKVIAKLLDEGNIIGFFSSKMEYGPRALGARSIIGDSRNTDMQVKLNKKIKFRESFRPFAPAVLAEAVGDYFEFDRESPYMLVCADVRADKRKPFSLSGFRDGDAADMLPVVKQVRSEVPAITHVDFSARLQTVNAENNPDFHALISAFYRRTGCPVIVNTSFNVRGEPIVCTPEDAYVCFMRTDMDALVLEDLILYKSAQPKFTDTEKWGEKYELD